MSSRNRALIVACVAAVATVSCGVSDGGQSGTGISAIRGNVVASAGTNLPVDDIRVSLTGTTLETRTDVGGRFELQGRASGPGELRFERERDGLFARTDVVIPAGGVLELAEVVIDPESPEAQPTRRRVEFEGFVRGLDCANGAFFVVAKEDESGTTFEVETASATLRDNAGPLACEDLREGDRVQVDAQTSDGETLINADVVLEDREDDEPSEDEEEPSGVGGPDDDESDDDGLVDHEDEAEDDDEMDAGEDARPSEDDAEEDAGSGHDDGQVSNGEDEHDDAADHEHDDDAGIGGESDLAHDGTPGIGTADRSADGPVPRSEDAPE